MNHKNIFHTWITTSLAIPITLAVILIKNTLPLVQLSWQFLIIGIIAIGYSIATVFIYRWTRKPDIDYTRKPDLDKYSNHLRDIFDSLKDNLQTVKEKPTLIDTLLKEEKPEQYPDYYNAIRKSPKKIALAQHLRTYISNPKTKDSKMFESFRVIKIALDVAENFENSWHYKNLVNKGFIPHFNQDFDPIYKAVYDGQPIFGACIGCTEFYPDEDYPDVKKIIDMSKNNFEKSYYSLFD